MVNFYIPLYISKKNPSAQYIRTSTNLNLLYRIPKFSKPILYDIVKSGKQLLCTDVDGIRSLFLNFNVYYLPAFTAKGLHEIVGLGLLPSTTYFPYLWSLKQITVNWSILSS